MSHGGGGDREGRKPTPRILARRRASAQAARHRAGTPGRGEFPDLVRRLPEIDLPYSGARGHLLQGADHQVAFLDFTADTYVPPHAHRAQWEIVVAGEVELRIGDEWRTCHPGEAFWVPSGIEHEALVKRGYRAVILFDQKDRYKTKG